MPEQVGRSAASEFIDRAEQRGYERGYLDALRKVAAQLQGSAAFNCGRHRGFEYPAELVDAMIKKEVRRDR